MRRSPLGARALQALAAGLLAVSLLTPAAAARPLVAQAESSLPKACPTSALVAASLKFTLEKHVVSYTSLTYGPTFPAGPNPVHAREKTCAYTFPPLEASKGDIKPVTITFEFPVSRTVFVAARSAASQSVLAITVPGLGDAAWYVKAPLVDPRGGNSLFVLSGNNEVVVGAPPKATVAMLVALVRKLV